LIDFTCLFTPEYKTTITPSTPEMEMPLALAVKFLFHTLVFNIYILGMGGGTKILVMV